jgi:membrane-associated phospholipid phosphatase
MVFLSLYLSSYLSLLLPGRSARRALALAAAWAGPLALAAWVAASRLVDNWHHPSDVLAGSAIGALSAVGSWALFYVGV